MRADEMLATKTDAELQEQPLGWLLFHYELVSAALMDRYGRSYAGEVPSDHWRSLVEQQSRVWVAIKAHVGRGPLEPL